MKPDSKPVTSFIWLRAGKIIMMADAAEYYFVSEAKQKVAYHINLN
jgi:hypothetical protein